MFSARTSLLAVVALGLASTAASASYLTYTSSIALSNPTPASAGASVTMTGSNASFQTTDIGNDGSFNSISFTHKDSAAPNNASGLGTTIGMGTPQVFGLEPGVSQNVGVDIAITFNFSEYADSAKTQLTGTGTAVVNGHVSGTIGDYAGTTSATFTGPVTFTTGTSSYQLSNFAFTGGDFDNAGGMSAHLQAVPEPATLTALAGAAGTLLGRRRRAK